jgi:hypothetical protein
MMHINGIASRHNLTPGAASHRNAWVWDVFHFGAIIDRYHLWQMYLEPEPAYIDSHGLKLTTTVRRLKKVLRR